MPTPQYYQNNNNNNPSKEIWANSGIYDQKSYGNQYVQDSINSTSPNTGISVRNLASDPAVVYTDSSLLSAPRYTFSSGNYFIDNMETFNPYRHYVGDITYDPQDFLIQTVNVFNVYSTTYRVY